MNLEELGRNPPDVALDHIVKDLLSFFNGFECLHEAKRQIEKKCAIKKEPEHKCWSEDYIKRAWEETIKEDIKSSRRKHWARVIMLQIVKSFVCDTCKQNTAQKNRQAATDEQDCETTPNSEDRINQSQAELETEGAAGGDEQMFGEEKQVSEVSKLSDDSGAASGSQLSASSTDEAPSPAEVNPSNSETKNVALVNENEDTLVRNCEQQENIDCYELPVADVHNKENKRLKNGLWSTVKQEFGKERSAQSSAALKIVEAAGGVKQQTTNRNQGQTSSASQGQTGTPCQPKRKFSGNDRGASDDQSGMDEKVKKEKKVDQTTYIRIPLSTMFGTNATSTPEEKTKNYSGYKLIDKPPEKSEETDDDEIKKNGFYVVLFNNDKNHAEWVYEILNKKTLPLYYKTPGYKDDRKDPDYKENKKKNPDYDRGHLAAAANHKWCQEAYEETYLLSNITPQNKNLNRGAWKKLEKYCRDKIFQDNVHNVHVYTGPLYLKKDGSGKFCKQDSSEIKEEDGKPLPTHYFKILFMEKKDGQGNELECFWVANEEKEVCSQVTITEIEELSGLKFIDDSPKSAQKNCTKTSTWKGNKGKTSVEIDVTISEDFQSLIANEE